MPCLGRQRTQRSPRSVRALPRSGTKLSEVVQERGGLSPSLPRFAVGSLLSIVTSLLIVPSYLLETNRNDVWISLSLCMERTLLAVLVA